MHQTKQLLIFLLLTKFGTIQAIENVIQWKYPKEVDAKITSILNFGFSLGQSPPTLKTEKYQKPTDIFPEANYVLLSAFFSCAPEMIDNAEKRNEKLFDALLSINHRSAEWDFVNIRLMMNRILLNLLKKNYWQTLYHYYKTASALSNSIEKFPTFAPFHTFGKIHNQLYQTLINYEPSLRHLIPAPLKIDQNLAQQIWSEGETTLWQTLTTIMTATDSTVTLFPSLPKTQTEKILQVTFYFSQKNISHAQKLLALPDSSPLDNYFKGRMNLLIGDYNHAKIYFERHLHKPEPWIFKHASVLGLFYMDIIENQGKNAANFKVRISHLPKSLLYQDEIAAKEMNKNHHPILLKARLLSDGQQWDKALATLQEFQTEKVSAIYRLEYYYRYGRIYYLSKNYNSSKEWYQKVFDPTLPNYSYFKAQAAYDCGKISEIMNDFQQAEQWYNRSINEAKASSQESIAQMAKMAIRVLQNKGLI